jgi:hypothetical protein
MAVANTLAYYDTATVTAVKSFIVQAPGHVLEKMMKKFTKRQKLNSFSEIILNS